MRVSADELVQIRSDVMSRNEPYHDYDDLTGAQIDCDAGLCQFGFTDPNTEGTGEPTRMFVFRCSPTWTPTTPEEVVQRLEGAWLEYGALTNEAHSIAVGDETITLDFVTWSDPRYLFQPGAYYTGRVEVALGDRSEQVPDSA